MLNIKIVKKIGVIISLLFLTACNEMTLFTKIEEQEANLMLAVLLRENLPASRVVNPDGSYNLVLTDGDYFPEAIEALSMRGYPRQKFENLCTTFKGEGMVSTPLEQKARYTCAKSQELSGALMSIDGIVMAQVNLVMSETDPISRKIKPASASVFIKYKAEMDIGTLIPKVKKMIAFGVESLPYQNVEVFPNPTVAHKDYVAMQAQSENDIKTTHDNKNIVQDFTTMTTTQNSTQSNWLIYVFMIGLLGAMGYFIKTLMSGRKNTQNVVTTTAQNDVLEF